MRGEPGSIEWAVAAIATSLAVGTPTRVVSAGELEDAAGAIVGALREVGQDRVLTSAGVWNLVALAGGEELVFARGAVAHLFDCLRLKVVWDLISSPRGHRRTPGAKEP